MQELIGKTIARYQIRLETPQLTVSPGECVNLPVMVINQGETVEHVRISLEGVPGSWVMIRTNTLHLEPGVQQITTLSIQPPRSSQSRAGRYPIAVRLASQSSQNQVVEARGTIILASYLQFTSQLYPRRLRASAIGRVTVRNQGNLQELFTLVWKDRTGEVDFKPAQTTLNIPAGQESIAEFQATPRHKSLLGGERIYPVTVQVSASKGESQTLIGEIVSRGLLPAWFIS
jgi:hypothetical protein